MPVGLNISTYDVKLVSSRGNILDKWVAAPLPPDSVKDGQVIQPGAVAGVIDSLFNLLHLRRTNITASISGMSFTYRLLKLPRIKTAMLQEAVERAVRKEINVPLDELYIDWQIIGSNSREIEIFVAGVPRSQIDSLLNTLKLINLKINAVDIKSLALSRASELKNGLIVDFEPDCFNIIILSRGIPVTLHTFNPKNSQASMEDNILHLVNELDRTTDFYNITHKDSPILPDTEILLTGEVSTDPAVKRLLAQNSTHPVNMLTTHFKVPPEFPVSSFAGNIGLVMKKDTAAKEHNQAGTQVNINPLLGKLRDPARPLSIRKLILPFALLLVLILVVGLSIFRNNEASIAASLQTEMDGITRDIYLRSLALHEAKVTQTSITQLEEETSLLKDDLRTISGKEKLHQLLNMILDNLPDGAVCNSITVDSQTISLNAKTGFRSEVFLFAERLEESGLVSEVRLHSLQDLPGGTEESGQAAMVIFKIEIER